MLGARARLLARAGAARAAQAQAAQQSADAGAAAGAGRGAQRAGRRGAAAAAARPSSERTNPPGGAGSPREAALIALERAHGAQNYPPAPIVLERALGAAVWDVNNRRYLDFLAGYSAVSQGHCHPKIVAALSKQAATCTLTSRAFYNDQWPLLAAHLSETLGYDAALPMNSGAEAVETAVKLAKKWAFHSKGVPDGEARILSACGCFHGRTSQAISMSCDPDATTGFGPLVPGQVKVPFGDAEALREAFHRHGHRMAAFVVEPVLGEGGVRLPPEGYLKTARELCDLHNVLLVADEVQTGLGRTGHMLAIDAEGVRADVVILGKALSGGVMPVSAVLADWSVMRAIRPGEHGSTFGGSPLASAVALAAMRVLDDEKLVERSHTMGEGMLARLASIAVTDAEAAEQEGRPPFVAAQRGRGLFAAVDVGGAPYVNAYDACDLLRERGVLTKPTQRDTIRLAPPLVISEEDLEHAMSQFEAVFTEDLPALYARRTAEAEASGAEPAAHEVRLCNRCGQDLEDPTACFGTYMRNEDVL